MLWSNSIRHLFFKLYKALFPNSEIQRLSGLNQNYILITDERLTMKHGFLSTILGRIDVSGLFLQQFGWRLCKAKSVLCSYST
ncbi:hypothetical protein DIKCMJMK_04326 [Shewanella oneidensis]|nr:hypothetical protein [Shewanella oneidensis]